MSLQLEYNLDAYERTDDYSGNVLLKVYDLEKGTFLDVLMTPCTLEGLRTSIQHLITEYGPMERVGPASDLHDYEYIHAELQAKLDEAQKVKDAEKKKFEQDRKLKEATKIYDMLFGSAFERWYEEDFQDHVEGEEDCKNK